MKQPTLHSTRGRHGRVRLAALALASIASVATSATPAAAQRGREPDALRGSKASVEKMYDFAQRNRFPFYLTPATLDVAIADGRLVPLTGDSTYELTRGVGFSYATREAKQFILAFAPQYLAACGTPLTVTSAARPMSRQPHNANPHSVHPTGIAVDIRRPPAGPCLDWVRTALADLEARGIVEATEEHHPVHLHVAVLAAPGGAVRLPDLTRGVVVARQARPAAPVVATSNGEVALGFGSAALGGVTAAPRLIPVAWPNVLPTADGTAPSARSAPSAPAAAAPPAPTPRASASAVGEQAPRLRRVRKQRVRGTRVAAHAGAVASAGVALR
jgi:hypothetical protein